MPEKNTINEVNKPAAASMAKTVALVAQDLPPSAHLGDGPADPAGPLA